MIKNKILSEEQCMVARRDLLQEEKAFSLERNRLAKKRRELPWVEVKKSYVFRGLTGDVALKDLFDGRSQLVVYHFMFGPHW